VHTAESFSVGTLPLASESPYIHTMSNYGIGGELMKVNLELLQNFTDHLV
jgi:hypothetical protein